MLFIQPAVVPADDGTPRVAEVQKVTAPRRTIPAWSDSVPLAQLDQHQIGPSNAAQNSAAPGVGIGGTPPISNPNNGSPTPPTPVGAAPPIPSDTSSTTGNTYGTQQERNGASGVTAPVTPGVPGPGAGTAGSGGGLTAPEMATPPAGNMDSGSSYKNLSSPYNSTGGGAGLTGTGMGTTAAPPSAGTTPGATSVTPPPSTSGASGTR